MNDYGALAEKLERIRDALDAAISEDDDIQEHLDEAWNGVDVALGLAKDRA